MNQQSLFNNTSAFDIDLQYGNFGECELLKIIGSSKIEVKTDRLARKTGNVAIEFSSRGKLSGIATTLADWWAFIIDEGRFDKIILIRTERLKELARAYYKLHGAVDGGDDDTSKLVLIPLTEILVK